MRFDEHLHALIATCRATDGVTSLTTFGSTAASEAARRDEWSDLDFCVFLSPDRSDDLRASWAFLPQRDHVVLEARESDNGGVVIYDDGMLYEFGAGTPWPFSDPHRDVVIDGGDLTLTDPPDLPDPAQSVRLFLAKLYIGMGRLRRGERVAANAHIRCHALTGLAEALRQRLAPEAPRSPFDPFRRIEQALPGPAARISAALDDDLEACAHDLFAVSREELEPGWDAFPSRAADVIAGRLGWG